MPVKHPDWVRKRVSCAMLAEGQARVCAVLDAHKVRTICSDAHCPNLPECYGAGCATFIIMGPRTTTGR